MVDHDFALALIDVQMPEMDGFELAELMRGAEKTKLVPIIFITAATESSDFSFKGYETGAVDFLYKPVNSTVLKSKVRVFIQLDKQKELLKDQMHELKIAKEAAEKANQLKSAFLANMSHEIRTPLGALIGFAELLADPTISSDEKRDYPLVLTRSGKTLLRLIDDILDLSKVEAGHLEVEPMKICPMTIVNEVIELLEKTAVQKGIFLKLEVPEAVGVEMISDPTRLRQILMNIIGNAIKFTEKGGVTVSVSADQSNTGEAPRLRFLVKDTGIGMNREQSERIFQPFMQADNSVTRKFGGTGLGLILAKRLAQIMGGNVQLLETELHHGSQFLITLSTDLSAQMSKHPPVHTPAKVKNDDRKALEGVRILLVEDSLDNQTLIEIILAKMGAKVQFANNGAQGVERAMNEDYDIVLMDVQMPVLDGYQATKKLRDLHYKKPIVALTAHAMSEEREKCLRAGCTDYLAKPIDRVLLVNKVAELTIEKAKASVNEASEIR